MAGARAGRLRAVKLYSGAWLLGGSWRNISRYELKPSERASIGNSSPRGNNIVFDQRDVVYVQALGMFADIIARGRINKGGSYSYMIKYTDGTQVIIDGIACTLAYRSFAGPFVMPVHER